LTAKAETQSRSELGYLKDRWLAPFNDGSHTALAWPYGYERSLSKLAKRMARLPEQITAGLI